MKVTFKIESVNNSRAMRTDNYIRVEVFEDKESRGLFWQSPKLIKKNMHEFGDKSYVNLDDFKSQFVAKL